jgi:hypothetical protein
MKCQAGACGADCAGGRGCGCWATGDTHEDCGCKCYGRSSIRVKGGVKIAFKTWNPKIKFLPNKIFVPANIINKKVTLSLKNNTLRQIISASGLVLSTPAEEPVKKGK